MKLACPCGAEIVDQSDTLPNAAHLLPDQDAFAFLEQMGSLLDSLFSLNGSRGANVTVQIVPLRDRFREEVTRLWAQSFRTVYQCPECGRLNVESLGGQRDFWFIPEDEGTPTDLLRSTSVEE